MNETSEALEEMNVDLYERNSCWQHDVQMEEAALMSCCFAETGCCFEVVLYGCTLTKPEDYLKY